VKISQNVSSVIIEMPKCFVLLGTCRFPHAGNPQGCQQRRARQTAISVSS